MMNKMHMISTDRRDDHDDTFRQDQHDGLDFVSRRGTGVQRFNFNSHRGHREHGVL